MPSPVHPLFRDIPSFFVREQSVVRFTAPSDYQVVPVEVWRMHPPCNEGCLPACDLNRIVLWKTAWPVEHRQISSGTCSGFTGKRNGTERALAVKAAL
jgi:hypothetical protein